MPARSVTTARRTAHPMRRARRANGDTVEAGSIFMLRGIAVWPARGDSVTGARARREQAAGEERRHEECFALRDDGEDSLSTVGTMPSCAPSRAPGDVRP